MADIDFAAMIERVALRILGQPNSKMSTRDELRFGTKGSLSVKIGGRDAGTWYDHEKLVGGGTLDLAVQKNGCANRKEAVEWIKKTFGLKDDKREIVAVYEYRDEHDQPRYRVLKWSSGQRFSQQRWDPENRKWIGGKDCMKGVERLPFLLPQLLHHARADEPVFICEGEKDVLNVAALGLAATCNSGGAATSQHGAEKWPSSLNRWFEGRDVVIIPDFDDAGRKHVEVVGRELTGVADRIRVLHLPDPTKKGYDVSDWLADGGTVEQLLALAEAAEDWHSGNIDGDTEAQAEETGPVALGYSKDGRFILLDRTRQIIDGYSATQLTQVACLMAFAPTDYWQRHFPAEEKSRAPFSALDAGGYLIEQCRKAGPFELAEVRGRGIWLDGDRIVVNLGEPVDDARYICFRPIVIDAAAEFDTARLLTLLEKFCWRHQRDAVLLLGWLAIAPICGVLSWRPHIWVHGPAKTGKTTLHGLLKATCSPLVLSCDGGSTEAGIRQTLGPDSLPVIIDEFEGDQMHLKGVLRLARTASSADDPLLRGTPEGKALNFCLRTTFAFSAVNPLGMSVADESRIVMLELTPHDNDSDTAMTIAAEIGYFRKQRGKWCSQMVSRAALVPKAIERFEQVILSGDRRHQQNMATLLGGAFVALTHQSVI
jgi:hypothetical protein